jgi:hypothetical protein
MSADIVAELDRWLAVSQHKPLDIPTSALLVTIHLHILQRARDEIVALRDKPYRERLARLCSAVIEAHLCERPEDEQKAADLAYEFEAGLDHE